VGQSIKSRTAGVARLLLGFCLLASASALHAVSPLVTDDADTVAAGKLQLNNDFFFLRTGSTSLYSGQINPVRGLTPRLELGAILGYQWRNGSGSTPTTSDADDITDLTIAPKFRLWQGPDDKLKFSARLDLKLPTASKRNGLGSGDPDVGLVGIASYKLGKTSFDSNLGYYAIDILHADFDNDRWFIGEAIRHGVNEKWTIVAETYGLLPNTRAGGYANWYFSAGAQWSVRDNILVTALLGSAAGHHSPDLTGTFEITLTF
jgi:outer membrane putative beta-barrel porin/alpha-amylase